MKSNGTLLYIGIKDKIIEKINFLKPNERLPSRNELVKEYGVTRTTIERAISELIGEGFLYARDGSGTYVSERNIRTYKNESSEVLDWGVILPNIMYDTYPGIFRGIEDVANKNGVNVILCNTDNQNEKQMNYIYKLIDSDIKGIIIVPAIRGDNRLEPFRKLEEKGIPFVFCNRGVEGIEGPKVISNSFYGGYLATKHLIEHGYRTIAFISRPMYSISSERYQGYASALSEVGIDIDERYVVFEESFSIDKPGYLSTKLLLQNNPLPDAIFCFNDEIASGAYEAIADMGLTVGKDIKIIGYDNTKICESLPIKLTSVKFKNYEIGTKAAELLLKIIEEGKVQKDKITILQPELVIRESCGCKL